MRRVLLAFVVALVPRAPAFPGGPTALESGGERDFARGTLEDLTLGDDGVLRPGPSFQSVPLDATTAWSAAPDGDGGYWIGTGEDGVVVRVGKDGAVRRFETGGRLVTAVAPLPGGGCAAAVAPGGLVVRIAPTGEVARLASVGAAYVWALAVEGDALVAATGSPGRLVGIDAAGTVQEIADVLDEHARCLAVVGPGDYLVGTAGKGLVLRVQAGGPAAGARATRRVLRDLDESEVVGVAASGRDVWVAANDDVGGGGLDDVVSLLAAMTAPAPAAPGRSGSPRASLQSGRVHRIEPDGVATPHWQGDRVAALSMAPDGRGGFVVGTGPAGRVVHVDAKGARILADVTQPEVSVVLGGDGAVALVSSNPAILYRRKDAPPAGRFTSVPLDAGTTAAWGRVTLVGRGLETPEVRGGETGDPDATWSPWQPLGAFEDGSGQAGLTARHLQVRARLAGPDAFLRRIEAVAQAGNHAPVVSEVAVARPKTPAGAAGQREVSWRSSDADKDAVVSTVEVRREGAPRWTVLAAATERSTAAWETAGWPDGVYEVRVTVSDEAANPPGRGRRATATSAPVRVDNRAPLIADLRAAIDDGALRVFGRATDGEGGRVASVEASVDGGVWTPLGAVDGILDSREERFEGSLAVPPSGGHELVVRATDGEGNRGSSALTVETP